MAKLTDIRNCKIKIGGLTSAGIDQLKSALHVFNCNVEINPRGYVFLYIDNNGEVFFNSDVNFFNKISLKEILPHNGNFYNYDVKKAGSDRPLPGGELKKAIAKIDAGCTNKEELLKDIGIDINEFKNFDGDIQPMEPDHQSGDIVFNKNGFKYKQFLCLHPLDSNVSLCQCYDGDILEVLNSELLSYSENLEIIKADADSAKSIYGKYVECASKINPMAATLAFDDMDTEGTKIWIEFAKRVTINEK